MSKRVNHYVLKHKLTEKRKEQLLKIKEIMETMPDMTQKQWAEELGWSVQRVNRRKRELEEYLEQGLVVEEMAV